jgi:hypothetical protein
VRIVNPSTGEDLGRARVIESQTLPAGYVLVEFEKPIASGIASRRASYPTAWIVADLPRLPEYDVEFACPEHGDRAFWSAEDVEAFCVDRDEVLDIDLPEVREAIRKGTPQ